MDDQLYTLEDWLEGKIGDNGREDEVSRLRLEYLIHKRGLPPDEAKKIDEYRIQAFDWAVEINVDSKKWIAIDKIEQAKDANNWLRIEIDKTEKFIRDNSDLEQKYEEGKRDVGLISGSKYKKVEKCFNTYKNGGKAGSIIDRTEGVSTKHKGKRVPSQLQIMYENKAYLRFLYATRKNLNNIIRKSKVGRPYTKKEIKASVLKYYRDNKSDLVQLTDTDMARAILKALDTEYSITISYKDPERSIKYWINER